MLYDWPPMLTPPLALTQSAQMRQPSRPGLPQADTGPVSGARKPILMTWLSAKETRGRPAPSAASAVPDAAVVPRNFRLLILRSSDLRDICASQS